jgi:hypothetical protein
MPLFNFPEEPAYPRLMDLDTQVVFFGKGGGDLRGGYSHTEADFDNQGVFIAEKGLRIHRKGAERDKVPGAQGFIGTFLSFAHPAGTADVTFDPAP